MKIVNKKKFVRSISIIVVLIMLLILVLTNKSLSHTEIKNKKIYINSGDTLWSIAKYEQVDNLYFKNKDIRFIIDEIKSINELNTSNLSIGKELIIPTM